MLYEKMKTMSTDELKQYINSSNIIGNISAIIGISSIICSLLWPGLYMYIMTAMALYILGNAAVHADNTKAYITNILFRRKFNIETDK